MRPNDEETAATAEARKPRSPFQYLMLAARGFCMGAADVVPGVSGGTMAFILGIYEELIESIRAFARPPFLRALTRLKIGEALEHVNYRFLLSVLAGIGTAIFTLAKGIEWLLVHRPVLVWSFFFGLVLASVIAVAKRVARWNGLLIAALIAGAVFAYVLVGLVPLQTPQAPWFLFISGAIAICAMILPGISGAFILVLLGKYQYILGSLNRREFMPIVWVGLGAAVGIVTFAQVLGWLFRRYHDLTVALLTGLMLGSLRKVWPWKVDVEWVIGGHGQKIPTVQHNVLPAAFSGEVGIALALAVFGIVLVLLLDRWANSADPELRPGS